MCIIPTHSYDHLSDPPLRTILEPWIQSNLVTYMRATDRNEQHNRNVQVMTYHHCIEHFAVRHEWMMFIDTDEYLYLPDQRYPRLPELLAKEFAEFSGLGVNWRLYTSSGHLTRPNGRFILCYRLPLGVVVVGWFDQHY